VLEERLARWLLMTHDRADGDALPLTQEFLSTMLGVRPAGVSVAAGALQKAGAIAYAQGHITILDRAGLEAASCECYGVVRWQYERALGWPVGEWGSERGEAADRPVGRLCGSVSMEPTRRGSMVPCDGFRHGTAR